ncbi:MAG: UDP-N-acetylmuramoyl-tripeptide--D-alanyl-D-alanine ligase [Actinobacteria bacterium]|nr:UDP-N-acetylmuramoyl-tripeptide--D-alanyl-D-alanine ligase [Actinomycetota bacterium]
MSGKLNISMDKLTGWTSSRLVSGTPGIGECRFSTDSRTIRPGDFFIPLRGENFDGHDYIPDAIRKGASGFVYSLDMKNRVDEWKKVISSGKVKNFLVIETSDSLGFLEDLARKYLRQIKAVVIGITGSVGKTTTKNFLTGIIAQVYRVQSTPKNYNNEIGISKAILNLEHGTDFFIAELGMRGKGQVGLLADMCGISIGAITAIGNSHMEFFNDLKDIALAKAEIAGSIKKAGGILFLNADDDMTLFIKKNVSCRVGEFGRNRRLQFGFMETGADEMGRFSFDFFAGGKKISNIRLGIPGFHNMYNACCAAAIGYYLGIRGSVIKSGLENAIIEGSRMQLMEYGGIMILNDCYNASPLSVRKAVDTLCIISGRREGRKIAILGDMLELGPKSEDLHFKTGQYLCEKDIDVLIALGKLSKSTYEGFMSGCCSQHEKCGLYFEDKEKLYRELSKLINAGDIILVKGSRATGMEDVIERIFKIQDERPGS